MTPASDRPDELQRLLMQLLDGTISEDEVQRLASLLRADAAARAQYHELIEIHALLRWEHGHPEELGMIDSFDLMLAKGSDAPTGAPVIAPQEVGRQLGQPAFGEKATTTTVLGFLGECVQQGVSFLSKSSVFTLLLAIGLPAVVLLVLIVDLARHPAAMAPEPVVQASKPAAPAPKVAVAKIIDSLDCVWADCGGERPAEPELFAGQQLQLKEGLAELAFADGAKVILRGPAAFQIGGPSGGRLVDGSLAATVPPPARGFTVDTPHAKVVDLGTEFGGVGTPDGRAEAHVFVGQVEVAAEADANQAAPPTKRVHAGEAVEIRVPGPDQAPQLVTVPAAAGLFVRRMPEKLLEDLPEPAILFAHRGSTDPAKEKWRLVRSNRKDSGKAIAQVGPVERDGTAAWWFRSSKDNQTAYYVIDEAKGLTPELVAEARQKGWVLRARVWLNEKNQPPRGEWKGLCNFSYRDGERSWVVHPTVDRDGNQAVVVCEDSSLGVDAVVPIPGSRNRYVDYEVRYRPATKDADVLVNGRRVATGFSNPQTRSRPQLRFGLWRPAADARFARVEWGILRDSPAATSAGGGGATEK